MKQPRHRRSTAVIRTLSVVAMAAIVMSGTPAAAAQGSKRSEQTRYATETMNLTYTKFLDRKANFETNGCRADKPKPGGCKKPSPYNSFDWTDDGCSGPWGISNTYRGLFNKPCQMHDFGYRNFGRADKGRLYLGRDEDTREWIDRRFGSEMKRLCGEKFSGRWRVANRVKCRTDAQVMVDFLRHAGRNSFYGPHGPTTDPGTPRPDTPPLVDPLPEPGFQPQPELQPIPTQHVFRVHNTCADRSCGLLVMTAPGSNFGGQVIGTLNDGTAVNIRCQIVGRMISGGEGSNDVWDQIDYAGGIGYVADLYMDTPGGDTPQAHRHFTSSIPRC